MKNPAYVRALQAAKKHLVLPEEVDNGFYNKTYCICFALDRSDVSGYRGVQEIIMDRLRPHNTVSCWLLANGFVSHTNDVFSRKLIQEYRHRWVDELIREFS